MRIIAILWIMSLFLAAALLAEFPTEGWQQSNAKMEVIQPVVYGTGGGRELRAAIYVPKQGNGPFPTIVFVHGGGWRSGSATHFSRQAMTMAEASYTCACIEYRLTGEAPFPAQIEDVKCAIRFMRAHAKQYKVDPKRVGVSGGSAGGHLALLAASCGGVAALEGNGGWENQSSTVQAAGAFNPVVKIAFKSNSNHLRAAVFKLIGVDYDQDPQASFAAEPETYLDPGDPPTLILHGTDDHTVPYAESIEYVSRLRSLGITAQLYTEPGRSHAWFNNPPFLEKTTAVLLEFMDKHLK